MLGGVGATVSDTVTVTDGLGRAEVDVTLGQDEGTYTVRASLVVAAETNALFTVVALGPPRLTDVVPASFSAGDTIVLSGSRLRDTLTVDIGGARAQIVFASALGQDMSVEVPACLRPGTVSIAVRFPGGSSNALTGTYLSAANTLELDVGEYVTIDPSIVDNCTVYPDAGPDGAQYLLVPHAATSVPNVLADYELRGDSVGIVITAGEPPTRAFTTADRFHEFLRSREAEFAALPKSGAVTMAPVLGVDAGIAIGDQRDFRVCNKVTCSEAPDFSLVTATAKYVGEHAAIYLDEDAPDTLSPATFQDFGTTFDRDLYEVATSAFGSESDVDQNGLVLILMTPVVNQLTPQSECESTVITGFFFSIDIDPAFSDDRQRSNQAEVFYALTPDPTGVAGCTHPVDRVRRLVPVTFMHEVQHMISYSQHVLVRGGSSEVLWLNEGLSHISEELAALHFAAMNDDERFSQFALGDLYDAFLYLEDPGATFTLFSEGSGTLAERGGAWLFLRWLIDQHGAVTLRRLVETSVTGADNVAAAAGYPFEQLVAEWLLANWVSDLTDFEAPARLTYVTWPRLRFTFGELHGQIPDRFTRPYPLVPLASVDGLFSLTGALRSGSGEYVLVEQLASQEGFKLTFQDPLGGNIAAGVRARLAVLRIR